MHSRVSSAYGNCVFIYRPIDRWFNYRASYFPRYQHRLVVDMKWVEGSRERGNEEPRLLANLISACEYLYAIHKNSFERRFYKVWKTRWTNRSVRFHAGLLFTRHPFAFRVQLRIAVFRQTRHTRLCNFSILSLQWTNRFTINALNFCVVRYKRNSNFIIKNI